MIFNKKLFRESTYKILTVLFLIGYNFTPPVLAINEISSPENNEGGIIEEIPIDDGQDILPEGISDPEEIAKPKVEQEPKLEEPNIPIYRTDVLSGAMLSAIGQYSVTSTSGIWTAVSGGSNITGINTQEIRWGDPAGSFKSGLRFNGSSAQSFDADVKFLIGDLTHFNWATHAGTAANGATLRITLNFSNPVITPSPTFTYGFAIEETPNTYLLKNCKYYNSGNQISNTPCDDIITFPNAYGDKVVTIGDIKYTLKIDGFQDTFPTGSALSKFVTEEQKDNKAYLVGHLSSVLVERPAISIIKKVNGEDANTTPGIFVGEGEPVVFTYVVQNTGNVQLTNISVSDNKGVSVSCPGTVLEAGASMTCTSVGSLLAILGQYTNIGTVVGSHSTGTVTANDPANYMGVKKVDICHATGSGNNPYTGANASMTADAGGHDGHNGPIWFPGIAVTWGDIIPPFDYYGGHYDGKNWNEYGQSILNNRCTIPTGTLKVNKVTIPDGDSTQFKILGTGTSVAGAPTFLNGNTGTISSGFSHTYTVYPGTYSVAEDSATGWALTENTCTNIVVGNGENKECTITNTKLGSLTVIKNALPSSTQEFNFTTNGTGLSDFSLIDNLDASNPSKVFVNLLPGVYSVNETVPSGWYLNSATCSDNSLVTAISLQAGEDITCTFNNIKYASISGHKWNDADGIATTTDDRTPVPDWEIFIDLNGNGVKDEGETRKTDSNGYYEFTDLLPGTYLVKEIYSINDWFHLTTDKIEVTLTAAQDETDVNFINVKYGSIKVLKNVDGNGDGDLNDDVDVIGSDQWSWKINDVLVGNTGTTKSKLVPGTYTITETGGLPNYHFVKLTCTGAADERITITDDTATINLRSGEDVVCTYRNARNLGKLIIEKEVINDNGGSKKATNFSFQIGSEDPIQFTQNGENELLGRNEYTRYAGLSYTITEVEANQDGYTTTYNNCENIVVPHNGEVICKITNNDVAPTLTVIKNVVNDNGGTAIINDFGIKLNNDLITFGEGVVEGATTIYTSTPTIVSNTEYTLSEEDLAGYAEGTWSCVENLATVQKPIAMPFTLSEGQNVTCTVTNNDIAPLLQLVKVVNNSFGGNAQATDWTLTATGPTTITGDGGVTSGDNFKAGTYTLSEAVKAGTTLSGYRASDWSCTNNIAVNENNQITLGLNQSTVCTITNSDIQPTLKLVKTVSNNHGGKKEVADFNLYIGNTEVDSGVATGVNANTQYTVREDQLPGYTASDWSGDCSADGKITLLPGENKTCYITNSDIAPTLKLVKKVTNDNGGKLQPQDWTLTATGEEGFSDTGNSTVFHTVKAGVGYVLSESDKAGYAPEGWTCDKGTLNGNTITLGLAENATCTITNNDIAPKLTLNKIVSNTHGGNKMESNWTLYAKQGEVTALSGVGAEGDNDVVSDSTFQAGSYTLSEEGQSGYDASAWSCTGTGSLNGNVITLGIGQEAVCSITNSDRPAGLTVIKKVVNDNGGTAVISDFEIKLNNELITFGEGVVEGTTTTYTSTPTVVSNTQYSLSEEDLAGYAEGTWSCVENLATVQKPIAMPFTLSEGQRVTCTVTNNDIAPSLQLVKEVNNNYGGEAKVTDWTLTATGPTTISGDGGVTSGNDFKAGTYTLSESGDVTGYNASSWSCTNGVTVDANNGITLGVGESTVCTIINSDIQPKLTVIKVVENGTYGDKKVSDFTLYVGNTEVISGTSNGFNAGDYTVREDNLDGYVATISGACDEKGKVTLNPGDDKTCTITNRSTHGKIIIKKLVEPNTDTTTFDFTGAVEGTIGYNGELEKIVVPRDYSVTETFKSGWNLKSLKCDDADSSVSGYTANIKVGDNETVTCTFTNEKLGKISGYKYEDKNGNGVWDEGEQALKDWTINNGLGDSTTTNDDGYYEFINLPVGNTYTITETLQPGWTQTSTTPSAITIVAGDDIKDINFGNFKHVTINVTKNVVGIDEETDVEDDTTFTAQLNGGNEKLISETTTATYTIEQPGTYTISEFDVVDYTYLGCFLGDAKFTDYAVESGKTYGIVCKNAQLPATVIVTKNVVDSKGIDEKVFSDDQFDVVLGEKTKQIADTANGKLSATFEGLQPGDYTLTETQKDGYIFEGCTNSEGTLRSNETVEVVCTNKVIDPLLNIEKSNDKQHIDQYAGNEVTYTITVTAPDDEAEGTYVLNNVVVFDIAPAGFKYLSGTWTAQKNGVNIPVPEPTYDDKGQAKWDIGDMKEGDVVVLTYKTKISLLQNPGNYPDIAWVSGKSIIDGDVLGASTVDPLTPFVGTDVTVIEPVETEEGEVLGASITLPVTGASTYLTLGALIMMILGVITLLLKPFKKLSYALLTGLMAVSFVSLLTPNRVLALDSDIKVRIMQPATPTNKSSFNVGFVALDLNNNSITVECYKDAEVTPFATFIANTGNCPVTVSASGTYTFFVKAKSASGEQKSADVTVVVDLEKPAPVIDYSKAGNVIKFKTPNDGKTKKVEIHKSTTSKYTANEGTRVHTMDVLPNTEYSWTDTTAEAGKTYYYALRTVDALGNVSTIVSVPEVIEVPTVSTPTATTTTTSTAIAGEVAGEKDTVEEGEVAGETDDVLEGEDKEVEKTEDEEEKTDIKETAKKAAGKWYIWVIAIVVIGGVAYYVRRQKRN